MNAQQIELRKSDEIKVVRQFTSSAVLHVGTDARGGKIVEPNPDYHPVICQREDGKFCDVEGRVIKDSDVPDYIRAAGKPPKVTTPVGGEVSLVDAMTSALTPADPRDQPSRKAPAKRSVKKK